MNKSLFNLALVLLVVIGFVLFNSTYIVYEGSQGIVTRFGKVVRDSDGKLNIVEPGLHFKAPFIDKVKPLALQLIDLLPPRKKTLSSTLM